MENKRNLKNIIRKAGIWFLTLAMIVTILPELTLPVHAEDISGTCGDNLTWSFDEESGVLSIAGIGDMWGWDEHANLPPWNAFHDTIVTASIASGVTNIGDYAFYFCTSLTEIEIPDSVTSIGLSAFDGCRSLSNVAIPSRVSRIGNYAFARCSKLSSVEIPNSISCISDALFYWCTSLNNVGLPDGLTSIGQWAFFECNNLTHITIPDSVTAIDCLAFYGCDSLTSIRIPANTTSIRGGAFSNCKRLTGFIVDEESSSYCNEDGILFNKDKTELIAYPSGKTESSYAIPEGVTSIAGYAFSNSSLMSVEFPDSITSIGEYSFSNCTGFTEIVLPPSMTSIGESSFAVCTNLESISIPSSVTNIGYDAFFFCNSLKEVIIPSSVKSISNYTFEKCFNLTSVEIPYGVENIGQSAFAECTSLTSVDIPNSVTTIENGAFAFCSNLVSMELPFSVKSVGHCAFEGCNSLTDITVFNAQCSISKKYVGALGVPGTTMVYGFAGSTAQAYAEEYGYTFVPLDTPEENTVSGICGDDLTWILDRDTGVLTISGTGVMYDWDYYNRPWLNYSSEITAVQIEDGVESIGDCAFDDFTELTEVTIPSSVTSIGNCTFDTCIKLKTITIPNSVTSIKDYAFSSCCALTSISIPNSVTSIGAWAFAGCSSLKHFTIPDSVTDVGEAAFGSCYNLESVVIPDSVTKINNWMFSYCTSLTSVTIPNSVTSIGARAFENCYSLTSITIPSSVTNIGDSAFSNCAGIEAITIPGNVINIGNSAFCNCVNLISLDVLEGVTTIGTNAFSSCTNLGLVSLPNSMESIGEGAFSYCESMESIVIPNGVVSVGAGAFVCCSALSSVTMSNNMTKISMESFTDCNSLVSVTIPNNILSIDSRAFSCCSSLISVTIPDSVTEINDSAFSDCNNLAKITILNPECSINGGINYDTIGIPGITTVYGYLDSTAQAYAEEYGYSFVPIVSGSCGENLTWILNLDTGLLSISGIGMMYNWTTQSNDRSPWYDCREIVETVTISDGVTSIGNNAFRDCSHLTSVTIPDRMTSIGDAAFMGCSSLTSVTIPNSVTRIGNSAFYNCSSLTSVTIPESVTNIDARAFYGCSSLSSITILNAQCDLPKITSWNIIVPKTTTIYGHADSTAEVYAEQSGNLFEPIHVIGDDLTWDLDQETGILTIYCDGRMDDWTWNEPAPWQEYRSSIQSITFAGRVTHIGNEAFRNCENLKSVSIPDSVTSIGVRAFFMCKNLESVSINNGVTWIGKDAFSLCYSLTEMTIPASVNRIGDNAFSTCSNLTSVTILGSETSIGKSVFAGCRNLKTAILQDGINRIEDQMFADCSELESIDIPNSVTSIGQYAFSGCSKLNTIAIPEGVTSILDHTFEGCSSLASIEIPSSVTSISVFAFDGCTNLTDIIVNEDNENFSSLDGVLFNKNQTVLRLFPKGKTGNYVIPSSVTSVNQYAFSKCFLTSIEISPAMTSIADYAFNECDYLVKVVIPEGLQIIGKSAFFSCDYLSTIRLPNSLTRINYRAFNGCSSLKTVVIPESVTQIGEKAFIGCGCPEIDVLNPNCGIVGSYAIGDPGFTMVCGYSGSTAQTYAEQNGYSFVALRVPEGNTASGICGDDLTWSLDLDTGALEISGTGPMSYPVQWNVYCDSIETVSIQPGVTSICDDVFYYTAFYNNEENWTDDLLYIGSWLIASKKSITEAQVRPGTKNIGDGAFSDCEDLTNVFLPEGISIIGDRVFFRCSSLTSITIPHGVSSIGERAFFYCESLSSVSIPNSVTSIGWQAFSGCFSLLSMTIPASVTNISVNALPGQLREITILCTSFSIIANPNYHSYPEYTFGDPKTTKIRGYAGSSAQAYARKYGYSFIPIYLVKYDENGGEGEMTDQIIASGAYSNLTKNVYTRTGYSFNGWNTAADGSGTAYVNNQRVKDLSEDESITLYAQWKAKTYTVKFTANGGTGTMDSVTATYDVPFYLSANAFTREGYAFSGWNTSSGGSGTAYSDGETVQNLASGGTKTLFAQWTPNGCEVAFDPNGGEGEMDDQAMTYNVYATLTPNGFTRTGFSFAWWNTAPDGSGTAYSNGMRVKNLATGGTVTLYAQWKPSAYSIKFHANYGSGTMISQPMTYGVPEALTPNAFTRTGYAFSGWNTAADGSGTAYSDGETVQNLATSGSKTLYAQWTPNGYEVVFDANGGAGSMENQPMTYGVSAVLDRNAFTRTGYSFVNWNTAADGSGTAYANGKTVKNLATGGAVTLYARWKPNNYTIKFYSNGGAGTMATLKATYDLPIELTANAFTRAGYTFSGWSTAADGTGTPYFDRQLVSDLAVSGTFALYAQWTPNSYEVVFDANGGTGEMEDQSMTYGEYASLTANAFTRTGYSFAGWNTAPDGSGKSYSNGAKVRNLAPSGTVTLYAKWKPKTYNVKFYANGGTGTMETQKITYDTSVTLSENRFTCEGYTFAGWNTKANGTGTSYVDAQEVENLSISGTVYLYARWLQTRGTMTPEVQ